MTDQDNRTIAEACRSRALVIADDPHREALHRQQARALAARFERGFSERAMDELVQLAQDGSSLSYLRQRSQGKQAARIRVALERQVRRCSSYAVQDADAALMSALRYADMWALAPRAARSGLPSPDAIVPEKRQAAVSLVRARQLTAAASSSLAQEVTAVKLAELAKAGHAWGEQVGHALEVPGGNEALSTRRAQLVAHYKTYFPDTRFPKGGGLGERISSDIAQIKQRNDAFSAEVSSELSRIARAVSAPRPLRAAPVLDSRGSNPLLARVAGRRAATVFAERLTKANRRASDVHQILSGGTRAGVIRLRPEIEPIRRQSRQRHYFSDPHMPVANAMKASASAGRAGGLASQVHHRANATSRVPRTTRSMMGPGMSKSLTSVSGLFGSGMKSPRLAGVAPRMATRMPGNIFPRISSPTMQHVYLPAVARIARLPGSGRQPRARVSKDMHENLMELARPEAIYSAILGETGVRLWDEHPEIAERIEGQLKRVAQLMPISGEHGLDVLDRYGSDMRRQVEGWLGGGSVHGVETGGNQEVLTPEGGALRAVGSYIGGLFDLDAHGSGESTMALAEEQADKIEERLRGERKTIDFSLLQRIQTITNRSMAGVEAYSGPMATEIASSMGAEAFTVGQKMFFSQGTLASGKGNSKRAGLLAHELLHASENSTTRDQTAIAKEERQAYGLQADVEQQNAQQMDRAIATAFERMELAKETNIPVEKLPEEAGGSTGTSGPDPGKRQTSAKVQQHKEGQILDALVDAVGRMMEDEATFESERGGFWY